jgi:hypothetical protein
MAKQEFKSTWYKLRELVVLSLNIIFIKDTLQQCERLRLKAQYINMTSGSIEVFEDNLRKRKHALNIRVKSLLEDDILLPRLIVVDAPFACLTRKQLDRGYAIFSDIQERSFALDLRKGSTYPLTDYSIEETSNCATMNSLEYNAQHLGSVLKYFEIDQSDPLKGKDLRY